MLVALVIRADAVKFFQAEGERFELDVAATAVRVGDPLFVDPAGGDFSFRPGSPALALGIEPLDVSKMGRLDRN